MSKENRRLNGIDQNPNPNFIDRLSIRARDIFSNLKGFKEIDSKDIHIEGIDPKSYGSFDRGMDAVTRFIRKHGIKVAALFALTSCNGIVYPILETSKPAETASAPSPDSTKTLQSPTDGPIEIPSTPGIESTINPPTQVPTEMPTATEMSTPTEIPEKYPIDLEKLHNFPQSYEYVVAHPNEFVEAPNPLKDIDVFNDWFYNKFVPLLGNYEEREVNYATSTIGMQPDFYVANAYRDPKDMQGEPEFFYFNNYGTLYPVITLNVFSDDQKSFLRTISIILYDGDYSGEGTGAINSLFREEKISGIALFRNERSLYPYPSAVNNLIKKGINAYRDELDYNQVVLGVGMLKTTGYE